MKDGTAFWVGGLGLLWLGFAGGSAMQEAWVAAAVQSVFAIILIAVSWNGYRRIMKKLK